MSGEGTPLWPHRSVNISEETHSQCHCRKDSPSHRHAGAEGPPSCLSPQVSQALSLSQRSMGTTQNQSLGHSTPRAALGSTNGCKPKGETKEIQDPPGVPETAQLGQGGLCSRGSL